MDSSGDDPTAAAVAWLLSCDEPAVRYLTRRELLGDQDGPASAVDAAQILEGPRPRRCWAASSRTAASSPSLSEVDRGPLAAGVAGGAGCPAGEPRLQTAASTVLDWLTGRSHRQRVQVIDGLARRCASQEGNALAVACRLGMAGDGPSCSPGRWWPGSGQTVAGTVTCGPAAAAPRSTSRSRPPGACTSIGGPRARSGPGGGRPGAELFLSHRLARSLSDGQVIDRRWLALHYPPYWHYDVLQALLVLSRLGKAGDPRAGEALELLIRRRRPDGRWQPGGCWWRPPGTRAGSGPVEVVDWRRSGPNEMLTLNALRVLKAAASR